MKLQVLKFNPADDPASYYVSGEVEYREQMTAMEALVEFHEQIEPVNFDFSCACRLCGRCAMMLDGIPVLACVTPITDGSHTFEPLQGYPVIRDLIVDKAELDARLSLAYDRVRIEDFSRQTVVPPDFDSATKELIYHAEFCCRCGVCDAACPTVATNPDSYVGPATMTAMAYRFMDHLDQGDRVMEAVSDGMYHCIMCGKCDEVCPQQDIGHLGMWKMLRDAAEKRGIVPGYAQ
ncbi:MAG: 4Fe-4S dicluster domain-containing protein [Coriobacteriales bacterium]|jgi:succinate dehydrogenase/fumarate reductase iron-sulfur protein|nr:4Fe-4S dicluster domain-containing protein [Coriobacteriales bacterium]